jgi:hypothetical protein
MRKVAGWAAIAFLVFFIARDPQAAAGLAKHLGSGLASVGDGAVAFVSRLGGGR